MRRYAEWYKEWFELIDSHDTYYLSKLYNLSSILRLSGTKKNCLSSIKSLYFKINTPCVMQGLSETTDNLNFLINNIRPVHLSYNILHCIYLVRVLTMREVRIFRFFLGYPMRGQRRWSNAHAVRKSCKLFKQSVYAYELLFWGHANISRRDTWSKAKEVQFLSKHKVVLKKKFVTKKIKKRNDLKLRRKKVKKSPWK